MMNPVNLTVGIALLREQTVQNASLAAASDYVQIADTLFHGSLAHLDFPVQRIDIGRKLDNRPFQHPLAPGKFRNVSSRLVQVLVQHRNRVQDALFFRFQKRQFLTFFRKV